MSTPSSPSTNPKKRHTPLPSPDSDSGQARKLPRSKDADLGAKEQDLEGLHAEEEGSGGSYYSSENEFQCLPIPLYSDSSSSSEDDSEEGEYDVAAEEEDELADCGDGEDAGSNYAYDEEDDFFGDDDADAGAVAVAGADDKCGMDDRRLFFNLMKHGTADGYFLKIHVENQGARDYCMEYAFVAALESRLKIEAHKIGRNFDTKLSVAHLIQRSEVSEEENAAGLFYSKRNFILRFLHDFGVLSEKDYLSNNHGGVRHKIKEHVVYGKEYEEVWGSVMRDDGPVVLLFWLGTNWALYQGKEVYEVDTPWYEMVPDGNGKLAKRYFSHCLLGTGYDLTFNHTSVPFFHAVNSYGPGFGRRGHMRISFRSIGEVIEIHPILPP